MVENNKEVKPIEIKHCRIIYRQYHEGQKSMEIRQATVPLDMDIYDENVAYKDNLEYFVQGLVDAGYCVVDNEFIPWHNVDKVSPCRETTIKKKHAKCKSRRRSQSNRQNPQKSTEPVEDSA